MIAVLASLVIATPAYAAPQPWALGFAAPPRIALAGDVDGDGFGDLVAVYTPGDCIIDVALTVEGQKSGWPFQGLTQWGKECQAATIGEFDEKKGADVVGIFSGQTLRMAGSLENRKFKDTPDWVKLPKALEAPALMVSGNSDELIAFSTKSGDGYRVSIKSKSVTPCRVPQGTVWLGDAGANYVGQDSKGQLYKIDKVKLTKGEKLGDNDPNSRPAVMPDGTIAFSGQVVASGEKFKIDDKLPTASKVYAFADMDGSGQKDLIEFRYGREMHTANQVLVRRSVLAGDPDQDHDGLTNDEEAKLSSDSANPDTDGDGLIDGWEVKGLRDLDLPKLGCSPTHIDLICLISRFEDVNEARFKSEIERVRKTYAELSTPNPDGKTGFNFHPIFLDPIKGDDMKNGWPANRDKFLPAKWRGIAHWMQVTRGGGGQADQLGDGGGCGESALWAVFIHEFGHQMGMDHEGFWNNSLCPIYTSLMNYAYSYGFEDDYNKIHYSDGRLVGYTLNETDLDETIPLPYDKVKFLEKGPYRFRLKPNGETTLVDWNWNGIFGEKHVRADINYSYSTNAGRRDNVGKIMTAPWLFVHQQTAYALYGQHDFKADRKTDPTVSLEKPGKLLLRKLVKRFKWEEPIIIEPKGLVGDPVGVSYAGKMWLFYQTEQGVIMRTVDSLGKLSEPKVVDANKALIPTTAVHEGRLYLFLANPTDQTVLYKVMDGTGKWVLESDLGIKSTNPVGLCTDTVTGEAVLGLAQNQDKTRPNRWQIRRFRTGKDGELLQSGWEWVEGTKGNARGVGRVTVLFEHTKDTGPAGRIYLFGKGMTNEQTPWSCTYVAHQVADKSVNGGWMTKRFYDEWTQSRSAPAAAWFQGDVIWAYRWVEGGQGDGDNILHVGYRALGIQDEPMGDHDDLGFFRNFGIRNSILYMNRH